MKAQAQGRDTGHSCNSSGGGGVGVRDRDREMANFNYIKLLSFFSLFFSVMTTTNFSN